MIWIHSYSHTFSYLWWGYQPDRLMTGYYFFFYKLFAYLPLLVCIFYLYNNSNTLFYFSVTVECNIYIYIPLIMAFLVKMPIFMFHFWLLSAHVEAPIFGSMVLAMVLLKLGGYGIMLFMNILMNMVMFLFVWDYMVYLLLDYYV